MTLERRRQGALAGELLTVSDVARLLHVHPNSVRRWAEQGLLKVYRVGVRGDRRFRPDDVQRFLEAWSEAQAPSTGPSTSSGKARSRQGKPAALN
ncbi:MAG: helix-turn-helix domain-containing protein [Dehalococcoidia bacterium]